MTPKGAKSITRNKLCVDIIGSYKIYRKGKVLKTEYITMEYPSTSWFEINNKVYTIISYRK